MATLIVPDDVYRQVENRAHKHGVSVEAQAAQDLMRAANDEMDEETLVSEIRKAREARSGIFVTEKELQEAKRWGRP